MTVSPASRPRCRENRPREVSVLSKGLHSLELKIESFSVFVAEDSPRAWAR